MPLRFLATRAPTRSDWPGMERTILALVLGCAVLNEGCGTVELAPPRAPTAEVPSGVAELSAHAQAGFTRVILDANGERATVTEVTDSTSSVATAHGYQTAAIAFGYSQTERPACITPCAVALKPGLHVLDFSSELGGRESRVYVQVGEHSKVVREAMGRYVPGPSWDFAAQMLVILGSTSLAIGGMVFAADAARGAENQPSLRPYAIGFSVTGVAALLVGIPLTLLARPQHQSGATTEFLLSN